MMPRSDVCPTQRQVRGPQAHSPSRKWMSRDLLIGEAAVRAIGAWPVHLAGELRE